METRRTHLPASFIWQAWVQSHLAHSQTTLQNGAKGELQPQGKKRIGYEITDVLPGVRFSTVWKLFLVRLVFEHEVRPFDIGSEVRYGFQIKGPLAWVLRPLLSSKIRWQVKSALSAFIENLERAKK